MQMLRSLLVVALLASACGGGGETDTPTTTDAPTTTDGVHDEIRAIGSLAQSVVDQGIPAVLGMRYSVMSSPPPNTSASSTPL